MDFLELAQQRYSVRKYADKPVEDEVLNKILETVKLAPTAKNYQPQKIYVVKSSEGLEKIRACTPCTFDAPIVFICCYDRNLESYNIDAEEHRGHCDTDIVQTHMMLEAANLGLGTCWVKRFDIAAVRKAFDIPGNIKIESLMPCGYPAEDSAPSPKHTASRELSEMVSYL